MFLLPKDLAAKLCCLNRWISGIETQVEFLAAGGGAVIADATTARTLGAGDAGAYIRFTNAGAVTVTVPTDAGAQIAVGSEVVFRRHNGAGVITLTHPGVTVNNSALASSVPADGNFALKKIGANAWDAV